MKVMLNMLTEQKKKDVVKILRDRIFKNEVIIEMKSVKTKLDLEKIAMQADQAKAIDTAIRVSKTMKAIECFDFVAEQLAVNKFCADLTASQARIIRHSKKYDQNRTIKRQVIINLTA